MKRNVALFLGIMVVLSCAHEPETPNEYLTGYYVKNDGSGLSNYYISFVEGELFCYSSDLAKSPTLANDTLWHFSPEYFKQETSTSYKLFKGRLSFPSSAPFNSGAVKDDILTLDGNSFTPLNGFSNKYWSSVTIPEGITKQLDFTQQDVSIPVLVNNPIPSGSLSATSSVDWISNLRIEERNIRFSIPEVKDDTSSIIELKYTNAEPLSLTIERRPSTSIIIDEPERTIDYSASQQVIAFTIDNPVPSSILSVSCDQTWVEDLLVLDDSVFFNVQENNSESTRLATFTLSYGGAKDITFQLTQTWSPTEIIVTPENQALTYKGGTFSFDISVINPRDGVSLIVESQSDWITDVIVSGSTINYKVLNNDSYYSRDGLIKIMYGNFASVIITRSQESHPITTFILSNNSLDLHSDDIVRLYVTRFPEDVPIVWSSDNESVVTVVPAGYVTARRSGRATVTAESLDKSKSASCLVNVTTPVAEISLDKSSLELLVGDSERLSAIITPSTADNKEVIWFSENPNVAIVDQNGLVSAISPGSTDIIAKTIDGNKTAHCHLDVFTIIDLSLVESANCYIVPTAGWYKFKTVIGNSSVSVEGVSTAETLWESYYTTSAFPKEGKVIRSVDYSGGYITFSTPLNLQSGNALIAAKDADGTILWSWHIWVCDSYYPEESAQTYYNNAGVMMDRNLGAINASPEEWPKGGDKGLDYQWGRKDPFVIGYNDSNYGGSSAYLRSTVSWPDGVVASPDGIEFSIKNPMVRIKPYLLKVNQGNAISNWDIVSTDNDDARWSSAKTIYDPCPPGWHVPDGGESGVWVCAASSTTPTGVDHTGYNGLDFSKVFGDAEVIWYRSGEYWTHTQCQVNSLGYTYNGAYEYFQAGNSFIYKGRKTNTNEVRCKKD